MPSADKIGELLDLAGATNAADGAVVARFEIRYNRFLDPKGKAIEFINKNEAFYGEATILGKPYLTGYEPMRDAANNVIGIYYVGYMKE